MNRGIAGEADAKLDAFFQQYLDLQFAQRPLSPTQLSDHRFDHLLDDFCRTTREQWAALEHDTLAELPQRADHAKLTREAQIDYEILEHELNFDLWQAKNTRTFEKDPRIYSSYISGRFTATPRSPGNDGVPLGLLLAN